MRRVRHGNFSLRAVRHHVPMRRPGAYLQFGSRHQMAPMLPKLKPMLIAAAAAGAVACAAWYLIWSPAFSIKEIEVSGISAAAEQVMREAIDGYLGSQSLFVLPRSNVFVFDKTAAVQAIEKKLFLERLTLTVKMPGKLTVDAAERPLRAALLTSSRFLALDESGVVLRELSPREIEVLGDLPPNVGSASVTELGAESMETQPSSAPAGKKPAAVAPVQQNANKFPLIIDRAADGSGPDERQPGKTAVSAAGMTVVLQANSRLPDLSGTRVRWFSIASTDGSETIEATMEGDWVVKMTTLLPFDVQGSRLALVLKEKIGARKNELEYVDLRFNERIFYRFKGAEGGN
jgi:hypothetical protein